jgi:hypothetical protein
MSVELLAEPPALLVNLIDARPALADIDYDASTSIQLSNASSTQKRTAISDQDAM